MNDLSNEKIPVFKLHAIPKIHMYSAKFPKYYQLEKQSQDTGEFARVFVY